MNEVTRRSRMKAERRQQLVRAASRLFAERGFRSVSMEDLAAERASAGPPSTVTSPVKRPCSRTSSST